MLSLTVYYVRGKTKKADVLAESLRQGLYSLSTLSEQHSSGECVFVETLILVIIGRVYPFDYFLATSA